MKLKRILIIVASALIFSSCAGEDAADGAYRQITQDEAARIMAEEKGYVILDVRTGEEYDAGHIPGAILIPYDEIGNEMPPELPDADQTILVYCRSGRRSKIAAKSLAKLGYKNVLEFGGINTWTGSVVTD